MDALRNNPGFAKGVQTYQGSLTSEPVAEALSMLHRYKQFEAVKI
jgi:alanine dehydrogenase